LSCLIIIPSTVSVCEKNYNVIVYHDNKVLRIRIRKNTNILLDPKKSDSDPGTVFNNKKLFKK
jgi:hypothetical protein